MATPGFTVSNAFAPSVGVTVSPQDIAALAAMVESEIGHFKGSMTPAAYAQAVAAHVDNVLGRAANPAFPGTVQGVIDQPAQYSGITAAKGWQNAPTADDETFNAVSEYVGSLVQGATPTSVGLLGSTSFGNPEAATAFDAVNPSTGWLANSPNSIENNPDYAVDMGRLGRHVFGTPTGMTPNPAFNIAALAEPVDVSSTPTDVPGLPADFFSPGLALTNSTDMVDTANPSLADVFGDALYGGRFSGFANNAWDTPAPRSRPDLTTVGPTPDLAAISEPQPDTQIGPSSSQISALASTIDAQNAVDAARAGFDPDPTGLSLGGAMGTSLAGPTGYGVSGLQNASAAPLGGIATPTTDPGDLTGLMGPSVDFGFTAPSFSPGMLATDVTSGFMDPAMSFSGSTSFGVAPSTSVGATGIATFGPSDYADMSEPAGPSISATGTANVASNPGIGLAGSFSATPADNIAGLSSDLGLGYSGLTDQVDSFTADVFGAMSPDFSISAPAIAEPTLGYDPTNDPGFASLTGMVSPVSTVDVSAPDLGLDFSVDPFGPSVATDLTGLTTNSASAPSADVTPAATVTPAPAPAQVATVAPSVPSSPTAPTTAPAPAASPSGSGAPGAGGLLGAGFAAPGTTAASAQLSGIDAATGNPGNLGLGFGPADPFGGLGNLFGGFGDLFGGLGFGGLGGSAGGGFGGYGGGDPGGLGGLGMGGVGFGSGDYH